MEEPGKITLLIDEIQFNFFTEYNLNLSLKTFDSLTTSVPTDDTNNLIDLTFEAFSYKDIGVYYNGNIISQVGFLVSLLMLTKAVFIMILMRYFVFC